MKTSRTQNALHGVGPQGPSDVCRTANIPAVQSFSCHTILDLIYSHHENMIALDYLPGVMRSMWAELAVAQSQPSESMRMFWAMRENRNKGEQ